MRLGRGLLRVCRGQAAHAKGRARLWVLKGPCRQNRMLLARHSISDPGTASRLTGKRRSEGQTSETAAARPASGRAAFPRKPCRALRSSRAGRSDRGGGRGARGGLFPAAGRLRLHGGPRVQPEPSAVSAPSRSRTRVQIWRTTGRSPSRARDRDGGEGEVGAQGERARGALCGVGAACRPSAHLSGASPWAIETRPRGHGVCAPVPGWGRRAFPPEALVGFSVDGTALACVLGGSGRKFRVSQAVPAASSLGVQTGEVRRALGAHESCQVPRPAADGDPG